MHRFFIAPELVQTPDQPITLPEKLAHQVRDVLHIGVDEHLLLLDNSGDELYCLVTRSSKNGVEVRLEERRRGQHEPAVEITLCQGLLKASARFEWILEKGTELGVSTFVPTQCSRSTSGLEDAGPAKLQRWQRILQEATEQCGRARVPTLSPIRPLNTILRELPDGALGIIPWEEEQRQSLQSCLRSRQHQAVKHVILFIGPEGGLTTEEIELARQQGIQPVTLGTRILRAETAALATVANVFYELEGR